MKPDRTTRVALLRALSGGVALLVLACVGGCDEREVPTELRLEMPGLIPSRDPVVVSVQAFNARGVSQRVTKGADYAVAPKDLATVSNVGAVQCQRSGDGQLTVSIAGVSRGAPVRCRIVARIEVPNAGRVELSAGPFTPKVRVLDRAGSELSDVEVSFFSKNSGVLYPKDGQLVPKQVGTANLLARAGQNSAEFKVDVVRRVVAEALPIEQNKKIYISLEPGKYELKVKLESARRLTVEWRGAPYCNGTSEGLEHTSVCALRAQGGGVVFDNSAYLLNGSKTLSLAGVELYEVP